ncbi:MAG: hypothetical protein JRN08_06850 [Nitrososphaerota archaeon]|nr:hypothetical protein [Nitrososphaerota archaeon]
MVVVVVVEDVAVKLGAEVEVDVVVMLELVEEEAVVVLAEVAAVVAVVVVVVVVVDVVVRVTPEGGVCTGDEEVEEEVVFAEELDPEVV